MRLLEINFVVTAYVFTHAQINFNKIYLFDRTDVAAISTNLKTTISKILFHARITRNIIMHKFSQLNV